MRDNKFNGDTIALLQECNTGCKMAIDSMEQVATYVEDSKLKQIIKRYNDEHIRLGESCHRLLNSAEAEDTEPTPVAKAMTWLNSQVKMMVNDDTAQAARILSDGCSMGMRALAKAMNGFKAADEKSKEIAEKLYRIEDDMIEELRVFL